MNKYYNHKCKCECGNMIEIKSYHKYYGIPEYISGHNWKNKKHTEETKKKMSISGGKHLKGKQSTFKNKKHAMEAKLKNSISHKGKKHTEEAKGLMSIQKSGKNNPRWKGGISCEPYCFEWASKEFKDLIKERDRNKCLNPVCFGNIYRLNIHHVDYNKKNCEPRNLITLCTSCNSKANKDRAWHEAWYKAIIQRRYVNGNSIRYQIQRST